jgi:hypothetical protein
VISGDRVIATRAVVWTVALAAAAVTVAVVRAAPADALAGGSVPGLTAEVAAGLLLVAALPLIRRVPEQHGAW